MTVASLLENGRRASIANLLLLYSCPAIMHRLIGPFTGSARRAFVPGRLHGLRRFAIAAGAALTTAGAPQFVGSAACESCHRDIYRAGRPRCGHVVRDPKQHPEAVARRFPSQPAGDLRGVRCRIRTAAMKQRYFTRRGDMTNSSFPRSGTSRTNLAGTRRGRAPMVDRALSGDQSSARRVPM